MSNETKKATCGTCPAFVPSSDGIGRCHAGPPVVYRFHTESVYPPVKAEVDWCLQHPERQTKATKKPKG